MFLKRALHNVVRPLVISAILFSGLSLLVPARRLSLPSSTAQTQQRPTPVPTPKPREEEPVVSDDVVRVESNLTNIFFTAEDKHRRFISTLKQEDIRILEDGSPQQIFTFQS